MEAGRDARALGLARAPDGASWTLLTSRFERAVRDVRLALAECGLVAGSRTPLERIGRRSALHDSVQGLGEAAIEVVRALEINRVRDGEIDLLANRFDELRRQVLDWQRALDETSPGTTRTGTCRCAGSRCPSTAPSSTRLARARTGAGARA